MEYTKDTMPDGTIYERYEGTPEEIISVLKYVIEHKEEKVRPSVIDNLKEEIQETKDMLKLLGIPRSNNETQKQLNK